MKPFLFIALVTLGGVTCGPVSIRDNNIGDITAVGMNVAADIQGDMNVSIANIILAMLVNMGSDPRPPVGPIQPPTSPGEGPPTTTHPPPITPPLTTGVPPNAPLPPSPVVEDLITAIREIRQQAVAANLSQEQKDQLWHEHAEPFVKALMAGQN